MRTPHDHHAIGAVRSWRPAGHNGHREQDTQRRQNRQNPPELLHRAALAPALSRAQHFGWILADRKSTRLNSSHTVISYAVFCLKKKKNRKYKRKTREHKLVID